MTFHIPTFSSASFDIDMVDDVQVPAEGLLGIRGEPVGEMGGFGGGAQ